jgi:hypothetical protein
MIARGGVSPTGDSEAHTRTAKFVEAGDLRFSSPELCQSS